MVVYSEMVGGSPSCCLCEKIKECLLLHLFFVLLSGRKLVIA